MSDDRGKPAGAHWGTTHGMRVVWLLLGMALVGFSSWLAILAQRPSPSPVAFVLLMGGAGVCYGLSIWLAHRCPSSLSFGYLLLIAVICRLVLLATPPLFDDDMHRYLWDGKVCSHGINPFAYPPNAPALTALRDENWREVNYPQVSTIYPPLAQLLFAAAYRGGLRTIPALKAVWCLFDVGNILLIAAILAAVGLPKCWTLAYAWSPLALKEFANSGHLEPVMLCFLLVSVYLLLRGKTWFLGVGAALGAAICVKLVPVFFLPLCWRLGRWKLLLSTALVCLVLYLPFRSAGAQLFSGTLMYSRYWLFNAGIFALLNAVQAAMLPQTASFPFNPLRILILLVIFGYAGMISRHVAPTDRIGAIRAVRNILAACLLLMPTVDPWYVCWLLPFLCIVPSRGLLLLTITSVLSYLYYVGQVLPAWVLWAEYLPVYLLLGWDWLLPLIRHHGEAAKEGAMPTALAGDT